VARKRIFASSPFPPPYLSFTPAAAANSSPRVAKREESAFRASASPSSATLFGRRRRPFRVYLQFSESEHATQEFAAREKRVGVGEKEKDGRTAAAKCSSAAAASSESDETTCVKSKRVQSVTAARIATLVAKFQYSPPSMFTCRSSSSFRLLIIHGRSRRRHPKRHSFRLRPKKGKETLT